MYVSQSFTMMRNLILMLDKQSVFSRDSASFCAGNLISLQEIFLNCWISKFKYSTIMFMLLFDRFTGTLHEQIVQQAEFRQGMETWQYFYSIVVFPIEDFFLLSTWTWREIMLKNKTKISVLSRHREKDCNHQNWKHMVVRFKLINSRFCRYGLW